MKEARLLRRLQNGESAALGEIMEFYTPYVAAIVRNIIDPPLQPEDCEEVVSDVFYQFWNNADAVRPGKLKAYLPLLGNCRRSQQEKSCKKDVLTHI